MKNTGNLLSMLLALTAMVCLSGCLTPDIPVIGFDEHGNPVQTFIPENEYTKRLGAAISTAQDSSLPALDNQEVRPGWMLRTMIFGIGVNAEIGIGPWKVGAFPHFRLIFSNSIDPTLP